MASVIDDMRKQQMMQNATRATGTRLEPYVNWRSPNPAPKMPPPELKAIGYNPETVTRTGRELAVSNKPNFTMPPNGPKPASTALANVVRQNFIMGETPEFRAAQAARPKVDLSGYAKPPVNPATGEYIKPTSAPTGSPISAAASNAAKPQSLVSSLRNASGLAKLGTAVGVGLEGADVAGVAMNPNSTGYDVAQQVAEGSGKLAAAGLGAKAGAALGAFGGPAAPITVPLGALAGGAAGYFGAGKLMETGREMAGTDPRSAIERLSAAPQTVQQQASYSNEGRNYPSALTGQSVSQSNPTPIVSQADQSAPASQANQVAPGVYQHGRGQYSDNPDGMGSMPTGQPSAQNMAAADALASRYRSNPLAAQATEPGGAITVGQSGGYGLLDNNARSLRNASMDAQQMKPGSRTALAALLKRQGAEPEQQIARDRLAQEGQQSQDRLALESRGLDQRALESAQNMGLKRDELADNSLTNRVKRDAAGMEIGVAKQLADLRNAYLNAKTPEEQATAIARLNALSGKGAPQDEYMAVSAGETIVDEMGNKVKNPDMLVNKRTGQPLGGQPKAAQNGPPTVASAEDMAKLPSGAVFIGPDGKQYKKN